ncbi:MAG: ADP-ribosylation factor-like protein [Promethearchaeota archaeon]
MSNLSRTRELPQKIALLGLANAGKTSVLKTILHEFEAFATLLPTTGVDRTDIDFFGRKVLIWDFGGQEIYRNAYLARPAMFFQGIRYLYFVIDAQDGEKLPESMRYFDQILKHTLEYSDDVRVFFFFHKIDPDYQGDVVFVDIENEFLEHVLLKLNELEINPTVFHTSIFSPSSVISAFIQPLLGNQTIYETLCEVIDSFCWDNNLLFGMINVDNFEIGSFFQNESVKQYVESQIHKYWNHIDSVEEIEPYHLGKYEIITKRFIITVGATDFVFIFSVGQDKLEIPEEMDTLFTNLDEFTESLTKILVNSEIIRTGALRTELITSPQSQVDYEVKTEEMQKLEGIEDVDSQKIHDRDIQLELIDQQNVKLREQMGEEEYAKFVSESEEGKEEEKEGKKKRRLKKPKRDGNEFVQFI